MLSKRNCYSLQGDIPEPVKKLFKSDRDLTSVEILEDVSTSSTQMYLVQVGSLPEKYILSFGTFAMDPHSSGERSHGLSHLRVDLILLGFRNLAEGDVRSSYPEVGSRVTLTLVRVPAIKIVYLYQDE